MTVVLRHWPGSFLVEEELDGPHLIGGVISGGQVLSGIMPVANMTGGGLWTVQFRNIAVFTPDQVRAWRALSVILDQGVTSIVVPICDKRQMPAPTDAAGNLVYDHGQVLHDGDNPFLGGHGYYVNVIRAHLLEDAALRATTLRIHIEQGDVALVSGTLKGGELFSIDDAVQRWRMYEIGTVQDDGDGDFTVTIAPALRAAAVALTPVDFDRPKCVMRLPNSEANRLALQLRRAGRPSVTFVEAIL
jgi:hypothetical protein